MNLLHVNIAVLYENNSFSKRKPLDIWITLSDPIYVLPLVVTATMWAVLEVSPGSPSACPVEWGVKGKQLYRMVILHSLEREN